MYFCLFSLFFLPYLIDQVHLHPEKKNEFNTGTLEMALFFDNNKCSQTCSILGLNQKIKIDPEIKKERYIEIKEEEKRFY